MYRMVTPIGRNYHITDAENHLRNTRRAQD